MPMKDNKGKKKPERPGKRNTPADGAAVSYTPEQRRLIRNGLGIWARVAIRSYLRNRAGESKTDTDPVEGEED